MGLSIDEQRKDFRETFRKADNRPHFFGAVVTDTVAHRTST